MQIFALKPILKSSLCWFGFFWVFFLKNFVCVCVQEDIIWGEKFQLDVYCKNFTDTATPAHTNLKYFYFEFLSTQAQLSFTHNLITSLYGHHSFYFSSMTWDYLRKSLFERKKILLFFMQYLCLHCCKNLDENLCVWCYWNTTEVSQLLNILL